MKSRMMLFLSLALLAGCAGKIERVVLLPDADGRAGAVVVRTDGQEVELTSAYAGVEIVGRKAEKKEFSEQEVRQRYGEALDAQPVRPHSFMVYFKLDSTNLTADSALKLEQVKKELLSLPAPEIVVIGHTDRVGAVPYNDELSLKRARAVRNILVAVGIPAEKIEVAGRGEREPLVPTPDETAEPQNRRVEIKIR